MISLGFTIWFMSAPITWKKISKLLICFTLPLSIILWCTRRQASFEKNFQVINALNRRNLKVCQQMCWFSNTSLSLYLFWDEFFHWSSVASKWCWRLMIMLIFCQDIFTLAFVSISMLSLDLSRGHHFCFAFSVVNCFYDW